MAYLKKPRGKHLPLRITGLLLWILFFIGGILEELATIPNFEEANLTFPFALLVAGSGFVYFTLLARRTRKNMRWWFGYLVMTMITSVTGLYLFL